MIKLWHLTSISIISIAFGACCSLNIPLSKEEEKFESHLEKEYQAEVVIAHDNTAVRHSESSGTFSVELLNSKQKLCSFNEELLKKIVLKIGSEIEPILSHRECYKYFTVVFSEYMEMDEVSSWRACMKTYEMKIGNKSIENIEKTSFYPN